jgi:hypothetical protein
MLGTPEMGMLIILISALPVVFLFPLFAIYLLQYLRRVLHSSAMGDTVPPRTPDRNFEGFFRGLGSWFAWLVLGAGIGFFPLAVCVSFLSQTTSTAIAQEVLLLICGLCYAQVALLLTFSHDRPLAANPLRVVGTLLQHIGSLSPVLLQTSVIVGVGIASFILLLPLRSGYYWLYLVMALGCWALAIWAALVTMRILGLYGFFHKDILS